MQRRALAALAIGVWVLSYVWLNWGAIDPKVLPLQVCGLMGVVAPLALLTGNRWLRAAMYFCTFTLTIQAFIQPILVLGPVTLEFWRFWLLHSLILCCAVYDLVVLRFRPGWSDVARACVMSAGYVALIVPVNLMIGTNYGFVGNPPDQAQPPMIALARAVARTHRRAHGAGVLRIPARDAAMDRRAAPDGDRRARSPQPGASSRSRRRRSGSAG